VVDKETQLFKTESELKVGIWIDLPNAFPWRYCIQQYNNVIATLTCDSKTPDQVFTLVPVNNSNDSIYFHWKVRSGKCVVPGTIVHDGQEKESVTVTGCDQEPGYWIYTSHGQFMWSEGCRKCVQSFKFNTPVQFMFCKDYAEDQNMELGTWEKSGGGEDLKLTPIDVSSWRRRQDNMRNSFIEAETEGVKKIVKDIDIDNLLHEFDTVDINKRRRAAVFYVDKGTSGIEQVNWWVYTWRFIGLDTVDQGFDLVMLTHPAAVDKLPSDCVPVEDNFKINFTSPGLCLYKPYLGVAYRDKTYDGYLNSQECLYGEGSEFLAQYTLLLRADLDTFPTPRFLDWWPKGIIVDKNYHTNFDLASIKNGIEQVACAAGIDHQGWYNPGSTWYGDARRVRNMAKITVSLNKFARAIMFGPGTPCRCSDCYKLPASCQWGGGPYAGTLLLYLQEIAVNKVLSQKEWDNLPGGLLDQGVVDNSRSVCKPALLHCMHNAERFSKLAFGSGKYKNEEMKDLDITKIRDFATFMALTPNHQGKGGEAPLKKFQETIIGDKVDVPNDKIWSDYCKGVS